ncbi:hypothetical protein [Methylophaga sulfidovorans]|uniref:Uncharacterized protein n=1 Tax=Methylophaga sulfidovorans TaxID=45496 RepID=A0A1I3Z3X7_9GAMM|nr:hypothetical protein [Methylophaga sulfidovorans]SFK38341.1 hypothetical protein SAMN04488079_109108 [Methylophaga sulfidovorans]
MNRLNTFLSISALSLASSAAVAVADDNKGFESKKADSITSSLVDDQQQTKNQTDINKYQELTKK